MSEDSKNRFVRVVTLMALLAVPVAVSADPPVTPHGNGMKQTTIEVWLVLSEPALATLPRDATEQRTALRERIVAEQNRVMDQVRALGAVESGRIQQVENAIAVRLPTASLDAVKKIDGVRSVRMVSDRNRLQD
ncbi:hypothetical protein [Povalibacter sp.]|uniref:hypothetical protein n=1 Tax=Povalibacter sp. TaxID=1962978 RepID=UPI002F414BEB